MNTKANGLKIAFICKGGCMLYVMTSKVKKESLSFMKKQLEMLHTQLVSIATNNFIEHMKANSCYDIMEDQTIYR
jgi:hypothetical protein